MPPAPCAGVTVDVGSKELVATGTGAFATAYNAALAHVTLGGTNLEIAGIAPSGTFDSTCEFIPNATGALYIEQSQSSVAFGGSTVGALLGAPNADVAGGTNNGWAIPIAGDALEVTLP
jgi:hypothetical protein